MKKILFAGLLILTSSGYLASQTIIADHTVVAKYNLIPQYYIDKVKQMWVSFAGESHSKSYRVGCELLEALDSKFQVNVLESGTPQASTSSYLRISRATWGDLTHATGWQYEYGEEDWFTNSTAITRTKAGLLYCKNTGPALTALGFGWCWDANSQTNLATSYDPVYHVRWSGVSEGGPQGDKAWGLDAADESLTGNSVSLDSYLNATEEYISYCNANNITTKIIFTTGPIDNDYYFGDGEQGYQRYLKYQRIRNHVITQGNRYLFDFADILSYNNAGQQALSDWTDHNGQLQVFPIIASENLKDYSGVDDFWLTGYHFGEQGALKIGKAVWWLLARMAGWDGVSTTIIPVSSITVTGAGSANTIAIDNGTLQLNAAIVPSDATNKTVTWSITNGTGEATISASGLVTALTNGTVTAKATANDGSGVFGTLVITISNQVTTGVDLPYSSQFDIRMQNNSDEIVIELTDDLKAFQATMFNINGSVIERRKFDGNECILNKSGLSPGIYIIVINSNRGAKARKIVITG